MLSCTLSAAIENTALFSAFLGLPKYDCSLNDDHDVDVVISRLLLPSYADVNGNQFIVQCI